MLLQQGYGGTRSVSRDFCIEVLIEAEAVACWSVYRMTRNYLPFLNSAAVVTLKT